MLIESLLSMPLDPYTLIPLYPYTLIPLYPYTLIPLYPYSQKDQGRKASQTELAARHQTATAELERGKILPQFGIRSQEDLSAWVAELAKEEEEESEFGSQSTEDWDDSA